jgi:polar amino acid transport system substrate-binding protein
MGMMPSLRAILVISLASFGVTGCASHAAPAGTTPSAAGGDGTEISFADQVERGAKIYGDKCASCHGAQGQGGEKAPPLVGAEALPLAPRAGAKRDVEFHTAADVFGWVKVHMPGDAPGSLSDEEYVDVLAFDLKANGVDLAPGHLDAERAQTLKLH